MSSTTSRIRRWWTEEEDQILRKEAEYQCEFNAQSLTKTSLVIWDKCAKRWHHSLDPNLDHSEWIPEDDARLLAAVALHGRVWKTIGEREFPGRSATELKNRFVTINRKRQQKQSAASLISCSSPNSSTTNNTSSFNVEVDLDLDMEDSGSSPPTSLSESADFSDKDFNSDILRPTYSPLDFSAPPFPRFDGTAPYPRFQNARSFFSFNIIDAFSSHQNSNPPSIFGANDSFFNTEPSGNVRLELEQNEAQKAPIDLTWDQNGSSLSTLAAKAKEEGSTLVLEDVQPAMVTRILSLLYENKSPVKMKIVSQDRAMQQSNNGGWE
ncbi:MAG: hypothetical protein OHK93_005967 [Ramalina farinacea]|uniref:Uncharacterized protein n=1 Tax=Ramalina farinacea TaxID=258253 RepID=A0AA43TWC9_9LECA|nr:hypothetical protein [Ramalina farinacea]